MKGNDGLQLVGLQLRSPFDTMDKTVCGCVGVWVCVCAAMALASLRICAGSPEPSLLINV